jgi:hypothetical protein
MKTMKVKGRIPGNDVSFPIGTLVTAEPCLYVKRCFNIARVDHPAIRTCSVPADLLEEET